MKLIKLPFILYTHASVMLEFNIFHSFYPYMQHECFEKGEVNGLGTGLSPRKAYLTQRI